MNSSIPLMKRCGWKSRAVGPALRQEPILASSRKSDLGIVKRRLVVHRESDDVRGGPRDHVPGHK